MPRISEPTRLILSHNKHRIILVRFLVSNNLLLSLKGMPSQVNFRVFAIYQICWVGKHINIILEPTNSPPQDQTNPRKARLKVAFRTLFPKAIFFFVGWDWFYVGKQTTRNPNPNQLVRKHPDKSPKRVKQEASQKKQGAVIRTPVAGTKNKNKTKNRKQTYPAGFPREQVAPQHHPSQTRDGVVLSQGGPEGTERHAKHSKVLRSMPLHHVGAGQLKIKIKIVIIKIIIKKKIIIK